MKKEKIFKQRLGKNNFSFMAVLLSMTISMAGLAGVCVPTMTVYADGTAGNDTGGESGSGTDPGGNGEISEWGSISEMKALSDGLYRVDEDMVFNKRIKVTGSANLILDAGKTMTCKKGITVGEGASLTISGSGTLVATGYDGAAGIGGEEGGETGKIIINGGTVTATGGSGEAGIGSTYEDGGAKITINGGTVTATGGDGGAGIGGGNYAQGDTITINGGTVTATGGDGGAGIGGGRYAKGLIITINGGTVTATGNNGGAGIGGGNRGAGGTITINGGTVNATGNDGGAGIGGGDRGAGGTITIGVENESDSITANGGYNGTVTIVDGKYLKAEGANSPIYYGDLSPDQIGAIAGRKLVKAYAQTVAAPTFSPEGGTYNSTQKVKISCGTGNAKIYYTTDGTDPTVNDAEYSEEISVSDTTTIKAIAVCDGMNNSDVSTAEYRIIRNISDATVSGVTDKIYTGNEITQSPDVKYGDKVLAEGVDFTLSYNNNVNAGTATVTITGKGEYTGSLNRTFTIAKADQTITASDFAKSITDASFPIKAGTSGNGQLSYTSGNREVVTVDNNGNVTIKGAGSTTITITASETTNYNEASKVIKVTVTAAPVYNTVSVKSGVLNNGATDNNYQEGESVTITANAPVGGKRFKEWQCDEPLTFTGGSKNTQTATFKMPAKPVTVTATYEPVEENNNSGNNENNTENNAGNNTENNGNSNGGNGGNNEGNNGGNGGNNEGTNGNNNNGSNNNGNNSNENNNGNNNNNNNNNNNSSKQPAKKGTTLKDSASKAKVVVISGNKKNPTVSYCAPIGKVAQTVTIPETVRINGVKYKVTEVGAKAFKGKKIKKVKLGKNVTKIGTQAFSDCTKLTNVELNANLVSVGDKAFYNCSSLTSLTLPAKTYKLGNQFAGKCKKLKTLKIKSRKLTKKTVATGAFKNLSTKTTIKTPKGMKKAYEALFHKKGLNKKNKVK